MTQTEDSPIGKAPGPNLSAHVPHLMLAVRTRRVIELIGVLAGTTLFWSWMLMPNSVLRSVLTVPCQRKSSEGTTALERETWFRWAPRTMILAR